MSIHVEFQKKARNGITYNVIADVKLGRPAPPCSNPDSPLFSDSGDPDEVELRFSARVSGTPGEIQEASGPEVVEELEEAAVREAHASVEQYWRGSEEDA